MPPTTRDREVISAALHASSTVTRAAADALADELIERHSESHRRYHTVTHVREVLGFLDELGESASNPRAVRLAAMYHDAVYEPLAPDNEQRSAELARARLTQAGVEASTITEVARLIDLTAGHDVRIDDANGSALIDADLGILASPSERYDEYRHQIRQEYASVDDKTYTAGRIGVLEGFVSRPAIFHTSPRRTERDFAARENMNRELAWLRRATD